MPSRYHRQIVYNVSIAVSAIDACFKYFVTFGIEYPIACSPIWSFIQKYVYEISRAERSIPFVGESKICELRSELERREKLNK